MAPRIIDENSVGIQNAQVGFIDADSESMGVIDILTQLAYRKALIAKITGGVTLAGLILCFALPVRYTATTKLMPPQQTPSTASMLMNQLSGLGGNPLAAMATGGGLGLKNPNDIYVALLNSRPIADAIINNFNLMSSYKSKDMTQARRKLADRTEVASEKSGLIAVSVTDGDKSRAAAMANMYTDELRKLTKILAVTEAGQRRMFYEDQLKQSKETLIAAELEFQRIQQQKGLVQLDAQARAMIQSLSMLRAQVAAKRVEVQSLRSYSTDQNPAVQLAEKELGSLQAEEAHLEQNSNAAGIANLGLQNIPVAGMEYLRAEHELRYQQALYDMLMKQYDAAKLDESKDAAIIQVVEPAIPPDRKSFPKRGLIAIGASAVGLFFGVLIALFQFGLEHMKAEPESSERLLLLKQALSMRRRTIS